MYLLKWYIINHMSAHLECKGICCRSYSQSIFSFLKSLPKKLHNFLPVYHVETPRPFISPLTLFGHVTGFFMGKLQDFSESCSFPKKNPVKWPYMVRGLLFTRGGGGASLHFTPILFSLKVMFQLYSNLTVFYPFWNRCI